MRVFFIKLCCYFFRILLSLRYRVKIINKEVLKRENFNKKGGFLFLPNHPAHLDPILLGLFIWPKFHVHPLVVEYVYRQKGINLVMKMIRALSIPNLESSLNEIKLIKAKESLQKVSDGLKKKENFLFYPAGRLKHTGKEILGGASGAYTILQECPETNVVLVRTIGLWGSSFSRAYTDRSPDFKSVFMKNVKKLFANLIFFMPRRKVTIEFALPSNDFPLHGSRLDFNRFLEKWYNQYPTDQGVEDKEPLYVVPYYFWQRRVPKVTIKEKEEALVPKKVSFSSKIEEEVLGELSKISQQEISQITLENNLASDLGLDSIDIAELVGFLTLQYDIAEVHPEDIETVKDVIELAEGIKRRKKQVVQVSYTWPEEKKRIPPEIPTGKTIQEAFFMVCDRMKDAPVIADDMVGVLSYKRLKLLAILFSKEIKKIPSKHVGVLFPASCGAYIVTLAILLAGKIPVMLNWTLGRRYLDHMITVTKADAVISSWKFLERLSNIEFGQISKKMVLLEDLKKKLSLGQKLSAVFASKKSAKSLLKHLHLNQVSEEDIAVVLFTSGTEANPKGVPLSHKNIISNQRSAMQCIQLYATDVMFGILPPFHSFGFSVTGLFPILAGLKVVFYPDPTDSYGMVDQIARWKATIMCSAPSFLKGVLHVARNNELATLRLFVTGAERMPKELAKKIEALKGISLIEGYGITECGPMLSVTRPNKKAVGVGQLIPDIELCIVDPETKQKLRLDQEGELCVRGPNIFKGYLNHTKSPFITIDGKQWYNTGDLGYLDEKGNIILSGRLKRFTKIGGEMISLGGLEEVIQSSGLVPAQTEEGPSVAVLAREKNRDKPTLVVVSTVPIDKNELNQMLRDSGFSRLVKVAEVKQMDQIPLTGTGKTDYRFLQTFIE